MADISVTAALLNRAAMRNGFAIPKKGLVFFGVRGLTPEEPFNNAFAASHDANFADIDHKRMRCTLGQWRVDTSEVALFPGSTAPSLVSMTSSRAKGGVGTNLLMFGRYEYERGFHKKGKRSGHRAFRQGVFFPVWRTADDVDYDLEDRIDFGSGPGSFVFDNLHCAYDENPERRYSSAGCQVVCGLPKSPARNNAPETGPWKVFVENGYAGSQSRFVYILLSARELSAIDKIPDASLKQYVRYGTSGSLAKQVQDALIARGHLEGPSDGEFGRLSLMALVDFQRKQFGSGAADGVCGENTAAALGIALPTLSLAVAAPTPVHSTETASESSVEPDDDTDLAPEVLNLVLAALGLARPAAPPAETAGATSETPAQPTPPAAQPAAGDTRRNFERAQEIIREFEGGFVNDPKDPGGATNFGITKRTLEAWRKRPVTVAEVAGMSYDEAKDIYFAQYWSRSSCDSMPGPLALAVYNVAVHAGPGTAARYLQRALNENGASVAVDGAIGGETLGAIPAAPLAELISDVIDLYEAKLRAHPNFAHFKKGFLRRVSKLRLETEKWLGEDGEAVIPIPTPKIEDGDKPVTPEQRNVLIDLLRQVLTPASAGTEPPPVTTAGGSATITPDTADELAALIRLVLERTNSPVLPDKAAGGVLTPVNAALGQTIGRLLDGRKSALGIAGALLSGLLMPESTTTATGVIEALSPLAQILPTVLGAAGTSIAPVLMPISLAMAAWGVLGKLDKYERAKLEKE